jgi:anti-sigma regulatory factor (Ser/Thr protein kinase)
MKPSLIVLVLLLLGGAALGAALWTSQPAPGGDVARAWRLGEAWRVEAALEGWMAPGDELLDELVAALASEDDVVPTPAFWARLQAAFGERGMPAHAELELYRPNARGIHGATFVGRVSRGLVETVGDGSLAPVILAPEMAVLAEAAEQPEENLFWFSTQGGRHRLHRVRALLIEKEQAEEAHDDEEHDEHRRDDEVEDDEAEADEEEELLELRPYLVHFIIDMRSPAGACLELRCEERDGALDADLASVFPAGGIAVDDAASPGVHLDVGALEGRWPTSSEEPRLVAHLAPVPRGSPTPWLFGLVSLLSFGICVWLALRSGQPGSGVPTDLTSEAAHEMRTPLTVMRGKLEVALRRERDPDYYRRTLGACLDEVSGLEQLQDAILLLTRTKRADVVREDIDLLALAAAETARIRAAHPERPVTADTGAGDSVTVRGDPSLLARAIGNLLDNAASHSIDGGAIALRVVPSGDTVRVIVDDDGPGIPPERHHAVFERFYRGPDVGRRGIAGSGLGLPIVRRIAELHGGGVSIEPTREGEGRLVLTLPRA